MDIRGRGIDVGAADSLPLASLPKTALQAIYHAVTGKTESLSKSLSGNVVITSADIDRLYGMLRDQLGILEKVIDPTVTVVVKHASERSFTYSSWERFKALNVGSHEITSDVTLKLEFVIQLPDTPQPQRCVLNVDLDSSLPVIQDRRKRVDDMEVLGFFVMFSKQWRTVNLSIDFVDFLVAKGFCTVVEEWFSTLSPTPTKPINDVLLKSYGLLRSSMGQLGRIGMATFLLAYVWFASEDAMGSIPHVVMSVSIGLLIWATISIVQSSVGGRIFVRLAQNIVPSVILLTEGDDRAYSHVLKSLNYPINTAITYVVLVVLSISTNVLSSYLFTILWN